jgi:hypothetical protein
LLVVVEALGEVAALVDTAQAQVQVVVGPLLNLLCLWLSQQPIQ